MLTAIFEPDELEEDEDDVTIINNPSNNKIATKNDIKKNEDDDIDDDTDEDTQQPIDKNEDLDDDQEERKLFPNFGQVHSPSLPELHLSVEESKSLPQEEVADVHSFNVDSCDLNLATIEDDSIRSGYYWASHSRLDFRIDDTTKIKILGHTETIEKKKVLYLIKTIGFDTACWEDAKKVKKKFPEVVSQYEESEVQYLYIACKKEKNNLNIFVDGSYDTTITNPLTRQIGVQDIPMSNIDLLLSKKERMMKLQDKLQRLSSEVFDLAIPIAKKIKL